MAKKPFRLITLLGIRPDIIRMFKLIQKLDAGQSEYGYEHLFMHTGQHFDYELDAVFYDQLGVRRPDHNLAVGKTLRERGGPTTFAHQMSLLFERVERIVEEYKPDAVMYLGDTNSVTSSFIVARHGIPVIHLEAGGRSFDWRMPEEKCRILIDHMSDMLYSYMPRYRDNLIREGIPDQRIKVIGNIIYDAVDYILPKINQSNILFQLGVESKKYCAVTLHREENTDDQASLTEKVQGLIKLAKDMPIVWPVMPRVQKNLEKWNLWDCIKKAKITTAKPLGFLEFLKLEKEAKLIVSDSGTVQEEALILGVPCLITRLATERPETVQAGATILSNTELYENAHRALALPPGWDRYALNPMRTSPSQLVYEDLVAKIGSNWFPASRRVDPNSATQHVREAYGIFQ